MDEPLPLRAYPSMVPPSPIGVNSRLRRVQESAPLGPAIDADQVRRAIESFRPRVVTITHVDTSTGVRLNVESLSRVTREREVLVVV
jgi:aspartate aminotransferase-like enzyme